MKGFLFSSLIFSFWLISLSFYPSTVYGHPIITDSSPKQFQSLESPPDKVIVYFSEPIVLQYSQVSVIDSEGNRIEEGKPENYNGDSSTISIPLKKDLSEGTFTVNTKVLSAVDGHVVDESIVFSIGKGKGDFTNVKSTSKNILDLLSLENSFSRIPGYIGQIIIVGTAFIFLWIQKPLSKYERIQIFLKPSLELIKNNALKLIIFGASLILVSIVATIYIQSIAIGGTAQDVLSTEFGKIIMVRLSLTLGLLGFLFLAYKKFKRSKKEVKISRYFITIIILGLSILFTNSLISHSAALTNFVPILIDYFHGIAASFWIGGLTFLTFIFVTKIRLIEDEDLKAKIISTVIPRFSIIVIPVLGSISITGPTLLWSLEDNLSITIASLYGKILIIKLIIAGIMIIIGGYHQFITEKKISNLTIRNIAVKSNNEETIIHDSNVFKKLIWSLRIETILGLALLFVVSLLANMALPSGEISSPTMNNLIDTLDFQNQTNNNNIYSTIIYTEDQKVEINLQPARLGQNSIFVNFNNYDNKPIDSINNATIKMSQLERNIGPVQIDMNKVSSGKFSANIPISTLGVWNLEVQGKTTQPNTPNIIANFDVDIKPKINELQFNITEYKTPGNSLLLYPVYQTSTNSIWVGDSQPGTGRIWEFNIGNQSFKEHQINGINLVTLSVFDNINKNILWFLDPTSSILGKYNTDNNKSETFELPSKGVISGLTIDKNENIWMTVIQDNSILKYDINQNKFETFKIPTENSRPLGIVYDKNNDYVWFAESIGKIGRLDIKSKVITEYPNVSSPETQGNSILSEPTSIILDPQTSNLYISDHAKNSVILFNTITSDFKEFPLTDTNGLAFGMAFDIYGNLWIAEHVSDTLAVLDPQTGEMANVNIPTSSSFVQYLVTDSKKDIWFAEQRGNALGKVTIKFTPSSPQSVDTSQRTVTNENNNTNQSDSNISKSMLFQKIRFNDVFGPLIVVALVASTILYLNSNNQLRKKLLELEIIENKNKVKKSTMRKK
ncbi:MAG TPA: copper resistance protein CopC [Nitrososphaeraceae archaeon]|nr:copper resistance protein CopC [Nitrososphaeraceae archaeon]